MTTVSPRSKRRRRLTIAALVLLVLGGGLWWATRPKIDPRFVGTWTIDGSSTMTIRPDGLMTSFFGTIRTENGGRGFGGMGGAGFAEGFYSRFRTRGRRFEVLDADPSASIWKTLKQAVERIVRKTPEPITDRGTIVDITGDSFTLDIDGFGTCTYRRVVNKETR